ncbi:MAG: TerC/Alx family metal homeostasis membrane protein [Candidatus Omnitrophica bacterium]|nr:TerC/Alx family metal homeostasis membrane protein [Candidatus Omnitrophota bacterium]
MSSPTILWSIFGVAVIAMLFIDFKLFSGKGKSVGIKEALIWSGVWVGVALLFNAGIMFFDKERAVNFLTGYLIERALSMDNIFVFILIFNFFRVPAMNQQGVLFWGILLALVLRVVFIGAGVVLINAFHWTIYLLGAMLLFVGIKMLFTKDEEKDLSESKILKFIKKLYPVTSEYHGKKFFINKDGVRWATPLFVVFVMVAAMDVVFAVDSIPAILAVTTDPFVVYTSNIFAILGLRALYSAIAALTGMFHYLNVGLCAILVMIGLKMLATDLVHIPVVWTLVLVALILLLSVVVSILFPKKEVLA